jgi:multidrug efflux system outer membrane protein
VRFRRIFWVVPAVLVLAGCVVGPDHRPPGVALSERYNSARSSAPRDPDSHWWRAYGSPIINDLVDRGLAQNLRIQQGLQRVIEARARFDAVAASPLSGEARASGEVASGQTVFERYGQRTVLQAGLTTSTAWQLDLFGRFRRQRESGSASLDIAMIDVEAAKLQFIAEMVDAVVDASSFMEGQAAARQNLQSQQRLVATLKQSLARGEGTALAVARAEALMHATAAQLPSFAAGFQNAANRLAVLLDEPAGPIEARLRGLSRVLIPTRPGGIGQPADLLRRRPDIRRAERALAVATADAGVAETLLYPSVSLGGTIGVTDLAAGVGTAGRFAAALGPQITIPILDLPRLAANAAAQRSIVESRHLEWRATVIAGISEVDTAFARLRSARASLERLQSAVSANERAAGLVARAFGLGAATYSEVLDVERSLALSREQLVAGRQQVAKQFVQLHLALGAGSEALLKPVHLVHQHLPPASPPPEASDGAAVALVSAEGSTLPAVTLQPPP